MSDEGVDEQANEHPESTDNHSLPAADVLDDPQADNSCGNVHGTENDRSDVCLKLASHHTWFCMGVLTAVIKTRGREDSCAIVEEVVGTSQLLTGLQDHTKHCAVEHARTGEDLVPWVVATGRFSFQLVLDLLDFSVDESRVLCYTVKASHVATSFFDAALAVCETWGLGQKQDGATEDDSPHCGKAVGNAPLGTVRIIFGGSIVDHVRGPDTQGNKQLVGGDRGAANALGNRLGLVHGNDSGKGTDTKTGSKATHGELNPDVLASDFDDNTNNVPESRARNCQTATEGIRERSRTQTSKECTNTVFLLALLIGSSAVYAYARRPTIVPWRTAENSPFSPNLAMKSSMARKPEI